MFWRSQSRESERDKLDETNIKQEERIQNLETKTIQLTSTTPASSLKCHYWWIPFVLSVLAALLKLFAFTGAISKVLKSKEEFDQNLADLVGFTVLSASKQYFFALKILTNRMNLC